VAVIVENVGNPRSDPGPKTQRKEVLKVFGAPRISIWCSRGAKLHICRGLKRKETLPGKAKFVRAPGALLRQLPQSSEKTGKRELRRHREKRSVNRSEHQAEQRKARRACHRPTEKILKTARRSNSHSSRDVRQSPEYVW